MVLVQSLWYQGHGIKSHVKAEATWETTCTTETTSTHEIKENFPMKNMTEMIECKFDLLVAKMSSRPEYVSLSLCTTGL